MSTRIGAHTLVFQVLVDMYRCVCSRETENPNSSWEWISTSRPVCGRTCVFNGGSLWIQKLGASVVTPEGSTHTGRTGRGQKPDIIDYFLVSTLIRPLILKCEVVKSVPWGQHHGTKARAQHRLRIRSVSRQPDRKNLQAKSSQHACAPRTT